MPAVQLLLLYHVCMPLIAAWPVGLEGWLWGQKPLLHSHLSTHISQPARGPGDALARPATRLNGMLRLT